MVCKSLLSFLSKVFEDNADKLDEGGILPSRCHLKSQGSGYIFPNTSSYESIDFHSVGFSRDVFFHVSRIPLAMLIKLAHLQLCKRRNAFSTDFPRPLVALQRMYS